MSLGAWAKSKTACHLAIASYAVDVRLVSYAVPDSAATRVFAR